MACEFLWAGKRSKIAYNTIIRDLQDGGLRLMDLEARVKTCMISWARRIILSPDSSASNLIKANPVLVWSAKRDFKGNNPIPYQMDIGGQTFNLMDSSPKIWYKSFITEKKQEIKRQTSWTNDLSQAGTQAHIDCLSPAIPCLERNKDSVISLSYCPPYCDMQ